MINSIIAANPQLVSSYGETHISASR